jgi:peroxiredoxin Q/BCP
MLETSAVVADFEVRDQDGNPFSLKALAGKRVVVYFYPKADTPGCTVEACEFRDANEKFQVADAVLVGVSPDKEAAQSKFRKKFNLPFTLLADTEHVVADAFGVWGEKTFMGKKYMGVSRSTFILGRDGKVAHVFPKVKPEGHAEEVFAVLQSLP